MTTPQERAIAERAEIDADVMARARHIADLYGFAGMENDLSPAIASAIQFYADKANHFEKHFKRLAKEHGPANAALDIARREWAKRGEG